MTKELPAPGDQRRSQLLRGVLDLCLLSLIDERPRYGFEFVEALAESGLDLVSEGSIYPLLSRMERAELISSFRAPSQSGGAPRKYYRLTDAGRAELTSGRTVWRAFSGQVSEVLTARSEEQNEEQGDQGA
ncbi:PadR family transcriptional regulator [Streptomyces sp. NA04227]|uniref:PadR family transcriptional regulator n=1 Tax=Streptomyces sp. NA04227 TaxID=2742136 RepID=UPI001590D3F0|nr:PadR family transcriptional regulator [Streptomyces sp. NA04227]QKW08735.1 PadR family transcriptional regulator [Streptomyces sp. NA04227]